MNLLSGILIVVASFILGASLSGIYARKVRFLTDFLDFIAYTEGQIGFYKTEIMPLIEGYSYSCDNEISKFLKKKYIEKVTDRYFPAECKEVEEFIEGISAMDTYSQKGYLSLVRTKTEKALSAAENNYSVKGGLVRKLIPMLGVVVFIILL